MRWGWYYFTHTFVNAFKKLFKSWVAIMIACILLFSVLIGVVAGVLASVLSKGEDDVPSDPPSISEELEPSDEPEEEPMSDEERYRIVDLIVSLVILGSFALGLYSSDKQGSQIFQLADATFLFPAPIRPQSVLLFRVLLQMGASLLASLYLIGQLPNLIINAGIPPLMAVSFLFIYFLCMALNQLVMVWAYSMSADYPKFRKFVRPGILLTLGALALLYLLQCLRNGGGFYQSATEIFCQPWTRWIPLLGWMKGILLYASEGKTVASLLCLAGCLLITPILIRAIWRLKADYYEEALEGATRRTERLERAAQGKSVKEKTEKQQENHSRFSLQKGAGAQMFFYHPMLDRKRTAKLGLFTDTMLLYLGICGLIGYLMQRFMDTPLPMIIVLVLTVVMFVRNFANPLEQEMNGVFFFTVPASAFAKITASILAGTANAALDLLPGFLLATVLMLADPLLMLGGFLLLLSYDWFLSCTGLLVSWLIPASMPKQIRGTILGLLRMFLMGPCVVLMLAGLITGQVGLFLGIAGAVNVGIGTLSLYFSALCMEKGQ